MSSERIDAASSMALLLVRVLSKMTHECFYKWRERVVELRQREEENEKTSALVQAKHIMKNSTRGERSMVEQEALGRVLSSLSCVPKMSSSDMSLLCDQIECIDCVGRTLIFLQGDFGECFYIIASGNIELYLESSKDKEMSNCRNFGVFRGGSISMEQCENLGRHIVTLKAGQGFGEYAILSKTHKFQRSYSCCCG